MVAATEVFHARGYEAGTLEDVAGSLDLRRASLYYYFGSKAELLSALCERTMSLILRITEDIERIEDPAERLQAEASALAGRLAALSRSGLARMKRLVDDGAGLPLDRAIALETEVFMEHMGDPDVDEGLAAFGERRRPVFAGA